MFKDKGLGYVGLPLKLWMLFYVYSILVGFAVQFLVLPILFPSAHWKDGLMVCGDWILFHTEGVELAERIESEGWQVFQLRPPPNYQTMSGITALFYALTGIHKPWVLLFYNAFLHSTSGLVLFYILRLFGFSQKNAIVFSTAFVVFPTSLTWVSQIHKDGLYILGMYLTFLSIALAFSQSKKHNIFGAISGIIGSLLFYIIGRDYALTIVYYFYFLFMIIVLAIILWKLIRQSTYPLHPYLRSFAVIFLVFSFIHTTMPQTQSTMPQTQWHWSPYIPDKIENLFYTLAVLRNEIWAKHLSGRAGAIDEDIKFRSVWDFIFYTPRAIFIGLFSPFPKFWFTKGSTEGGTIARYITPFEAFYLYIAWAFLPAVIWINRNKLWFLFILLMCIGFIWFHSVAEPNVGPIVRKRYGYVMMLSAISYCTILEKLRKVR